MIGLRITVPEQTSRIWGPALLMLIALTGGLMLRRGRIRAATSVLAYGLWVGVTGIAAFTGGVRAPAVVGYPVIILMVAWMIGVRSALFIAGLTLSATLAMYWLERGGVLSQLLPSSSGMHATDQAVVYTLTAAVAVFLVRSYQHRMDELRRVGIDLGRRKRELESSNAELQRAQAYERYRNQTLELMAGGAALASVLQAIALGVEQFNPDMLCSVLLLDADGKHLGRGVAPSLPDFYSSALEGIEIGMGVGSCGTSAFTGERVITTDISSHPYWKPYAELAASADLAACWSQPIRSSTDQVLGTFAIYHRTPHTPESSDIALIEQAAHLASIAIEKSGAADKLKASEEHHRAMVEWTPESILIHRAGIILYVNPAAIRLFGASNTQDLVGKTTRELIHPEFLEQQSERMKSIIGRLAIKPMVESRFLKLDGSAIDVEVQGTSIAFGGEAAIHVSIRDISERKQAQAQLHLAASVFAHAREGIMITGADACIIDVNDTFSRITGYSREEVMGKNPRILSSGRQDASFYAAMWQALLDQGHWSGELWNRRKDGEIYAEMQTISAVRDANGVTRQYVSLFSDITPLKEHQKQLEHIAHYDALTNLPNRALLADRLHQAMAQEQRREQRLAVAFLDLDRFKAINDQYGHDVGDQMLVAVAAHMKQALRDGDTLARLGGDEFVAVLLDIPDAAASVPMLRRLLAAAALPVQIGVLTLQVSASLGVTFYPQRDDVDADQLLRQADQAMYQAKLAGMNRYHVFDSDQDSSIRGHHESLERIREAIAADEFVLHYQPKVNMRTGTVMGAEALIRWQHPQRGLLPPAAFLPVIETHALAIDIGEWVMGTALEQMTSWKRQGLHIPVSVNVGGHQLQQPDFVARLQEILAAHPEVGPGELELEVLETSALEDITQVSQVMESCSAMGVRFAIDDFGTGYSSLTYLKRLPVAVLKIDQSFVRDMLDDADDLSILQGIISLASAFRRQVIAEGVETVAHGTLLLQLGCELAQGYGIARPMPAQDFPQWSRSWKPDPAWQQATEMAKA